ncbi:MAG: 4Fe-4S dicluster domain-containing protein [Desulfobacteraceae bacterium]|nr:4Fe-4S dicluster domain-containing protein [Desulfobacteraceae bacterium]
METRYLLRKDHLLPLLRRLQKGHRLVAPARNRHGDTFYAEVRDLDRFHLDLDTPPQESAKRFFLPQQEVLFTYRTDGPEGYGFSPVVAPSPPTVYFGLRPCDLTAILYTDLVLLKERRDPGYQRRRQEAVLIALGCSRPRASCFCNATKSGPFLDFGYDLQLTDLGDRFFVEVGRARGRQLVEDWHPFFAEAGEEDVKAQYQVALEAAGSFERSVDLDLAVRALADHGGSDALWAELASRCQGCGGCAFLCPTCTCYTLRDQCLGPSHGERLRCWDACTLAGFTRMAGGHNPADPGRDVLRRRFEHKLRDSVRQHGRPSCVGCGRCVGSCFGGVDMLMAIERLAGEAEPPEEGV